MSSEALLRGIAELTLRPSPRARVMRLTVDPRTGGIVLSFPRRVSRRRALEWAAGQRTWIEAALAGVPKPVPIEPGAEIMWQGIAHVIDWSAAHPRATCARDGRILAGGPVELVEQRVLRWMKAEARATLDSETRYYAERAGVIVTRVSVGDPLSRWGSCSSSGGIRYSWRLMLAPDWVRRATVAHEVAHRVHMNHGPGFHTLVEKLLGADPTLARNWLRRHGAGLQRVGTPPKPGL